MPKRVSSLDGHDIARPKLRIAQQGAKVHCMPAVNQTVVRWYY